MRKNENAWKNAMYNYSRFFVVCLVAFAMVFMSYPYSLYAAETASDTIVQEAKNESELLLSLRTALWLRYMDVRNAYTKDYKAWVSGGKVGAEPTPPGEFNTFTLSGLTGTYLPDSFPISDYSIATQSKELVLSKNISTATANIVPNFIPLAQITPATAEDSTVEFFVSRPGATAEFDMEEYVWKDRANTMASPATLEWENWDADLGAKTGVESFIAVNKTFLRTIEGANGSILSFGTPGVTSLTGDLDIANTLTATDGTFTTLQAATMDLTGDMDIDGTLTVANVDIQNKILSDMTLANDKEIKLDEGAVRLKASGTDLSVNNNEGYITMGRHGTQARFDTNADEFYFGKNIRVARLLGKADFATHADSASTADNAKQFGLRTPEEWEKWIKEQVKKNSTNLIPLFNNLLSKSPYVENFYPNTSTLNMSNVQRDVVLLTRQRLSALTGLSVSQINITSVSGDFCNNLAYAFKTGARSYKKVEIKDSNGKWYVYAQDSDSFDYYAGRRPQNKRITFTASSSVRLTATRSEGGGRTYNWHNDQRNISTATQLRIYGCR